MALIALTQVSNGLTFEIDANNIVEVVANGTGSDVSYFYQGAQSKIVNVTQSPTAIQALAPNIISVTDVSGSSLAGGITATITYNTLVGTFEIGETLLVNGIGGGTIASDSGSVLVVNFFSAPLPSGAKLSGRNSAATATLTGTTTYTYNTSYTRYINAVRILTADSANIGAVNQLGYYDADNSVVEFIFVSNTLAAIQTAANNGLNGYPNFVKTTVTQGTSITTGVTASAPAGVITTFSAAIAAQASAEFTVTNTFVSASSVVLANIVDYAGTDSTNGIPVVKVDTIGAGSFKIVISNAHSTNALSGVLKVGFIVV
jgi:hypothetical protein